jgi:hypothetical protein
MDFANEKVSAARKNSSLKCVQDALSGSHAFSFDPGPMIYQGVDCALVSNGGLPTYDPNSRH